MTANKDFMQHFFDEVWTAGRTAAIDEMVSADCRAHGLGNEVIRGNEGFKQFQQALLRIVGDVRVTVHEQLIEGDRTAVRATLTGRHMQTGKPVSMTGGGIVRVVDGKIVEAWNMWDFLGFLEQIGHVQPNALLAALTA